MEVEAIYLSLALEFVSDDIFLIRDIEFQIYIISIKAYYTIWKL